MLALDTQFSISSLHVLYANRAVMSLCVVRAVGMLTLLCSLRRAASLRPAKASRAGSVHVLGMTHASVTSRRWWKSSRVCRRGGGVEL